MVIKTGFKVYEQIGTSASHLFHRFTKTLPHYFTAAVGGKCDL